MANYTDACVVDPSCCCSWPTGQFEWSRWGPGTPAKCSFHERMSAGTTAFQSMIITITLLIYGYLIRIAKMIRKSANGLRAVSFR